METCRPCTLKGNVYACGNIRLGSPALCVHHNISSFSADCNKAFLFLLATTTFSSLYLHIIYIYIYIAMNPIYAYIYTHSLSLSSIPSFTTKLLIQKDIDPLLHHAYCLKLCDSSYHCFNIQAEAVWASWVLFHFMRWMVCGGAASSWNWWSIASQDSWNIEAQLNEGNQALLVRNHWNYLFINY